MDTPNASPTAPALLPGARTWLLRLPVLVLAIGLLVSLAADALLIGPVFGRPRLALERDIDTLVVGASHSACAFDPQVLGHAASVARHGELMLSTEAKLEALLGANPQVRTVILAFSPIHVAAWQDAYLFGGNAESRAQVMDYYPLYNERTRALFPLANADALLASLKYDHGVPFDYTEDSILYAHYVLGSLTPQSYRFWGGFTPIRGTHLGPALMDRVIRKYFQEDGEVAGISALAIESLMRMVALTQERGVRLVLVDTPVHPRFRARVPERHRAAHAEVLDDVARRYPAVEIVRHSDLDLPDKWFLDPDHLNRPGARAYTERLVALLEEGAAR